MDSQAEWDDIDAQQRDILLKRIADMRQADWPEDAIVEAVEGWPREWRELVKGRF